MKNVHHTSTKQHRGMKSGISRSKNAYIFASLVCKCTVLLEGVKVQLSHRHVNVIALHVLCGCNCKTSRIWYHL